MTGNRIRRVLVTYPLEPPSLIDHLRSTTGPDVVFDFFPGKSGTDYSTTEVPLPSAEILREADAIFMFRLPENLTHISQTPKLKLIQVVGSGVGQITTSQLWKSISETASSEPSRRVQLCNSAGIHASPIGEHVIMCILMLLHKMQMVSGYIRMEKRWPLPTELGPGGLFKREIRGLTIGILGYGAIGREVARLAKAFGANIIVATRSGVQSAHEGYQEVGMGDAEGTLPSKWYCSQDKSAVADFLKSADIVVNMLPSTSANQNFIGREELKIMKNSALFINAGRGDTVDQDALIEALQAHTGMGEYDVAGSLAISGAALDVTVPEPLPDGHILYSLPNVILTPHSSWASLHNFHRACELLKVNISRFNSDQPPLNIQRNQDR